MIASVSDVLKARTVAKDTLQNLCIPIFEAQGVEVTRNNESEMIIYCENLIPLKNDYKFGEKFEDTQEIYIHKNNASVIKIQNFSEEFATTGLLDEQIEDAAK